MELRITRVAPLSHYVRVCKIKISHVSAWPYASGSELTYTALTVRRITILVYFVLYIVRIFIICA
jgi:hypothetical protein